MDTLQVGDIAHAIQLALAPVFLLSGIGVMLGVLTNRLARVVDRARRVEESLHHATAPDIPAARDQLRVASRRARFINTSITLCTIAALLIAGCAHEPLAAHPPPRRRLQAAVPHHRLQARQDRHSRQGDDH